MNRRFGALVLASLLAAMPASAQQLRVTGITTIRYVGIRPLLEDSILAADVPGGSLLRETADGLTVRCVEGAAYCRFYRSGDAVAAVPTTQDLRFSAWGFGRGLRVYARARARAAVGSDAVWPRSDDALDVLEAYGELDRPRVRLRAGRQWTTTGLGVYNFDGAALRLRLAPRLMLEGYGGWSLVRGLNEPITSGALAAVEAFVPEERGLLAGARLRVRPTAASALSVTYQREIRSDRAGLYSERVAAELGVRSRVVTIDADLEADLALGVINEARARMSAYAARSLTMSLFARRHRPYFDLWTIWGAFAPVGFDEAGGGIAWTGARWTAEARAGWRSYADAGTNLALAPFNDTGWNAGVSLRAELLPSWSLQAWYDVDVGFGAARSQGGGRVQKSLPGDGYVALTATAFQRAYEFRVRSGTVAGLGIDAGAPLGERARISGGLDAYVHGGTDPDVDWSQLRGSARVEWTIGAEPGRMGGGGP